MYHIVVSLSIWDTFCWVLKTINNHWALKPVFIDLSLLKGLRKASSLPSTPITFEGVHLRRFNESLFIETRLTVIEVLVH